MSPRRWLARSAERVALLGKASLLRWGLWVNPLFDHDWYRAHYPGVPPSRRRAYRDYRRRLLSDARDPNRFMDMRWFLGQQPDLLKARLHPLDHYLLLGWREGREPKPGFDSQGFLRRHPDRAARRTNPVLYLLRQGARHPVSSLHIQNPPLLDGPAATSDTAAGDSAGAGAVWLADGAVIEGWLADDVQLRAVEVRCDGELVWRGPPRRSIVDPAGGRHACGFRLDLPPSTAGSRRSLVEVTAVDLGSLPGTPLAVDCLDRFAGRVERIVREGEGLLVEGWVHDASRPLDPLEVEVRLDGQPRSTVVAARYREDLEYAGLGVGRHAFEERIEVGGEVVRSVTLAIAGTPLFLCRDVAPDGGGSGSPDGEASTPASEPAGAGAGEGPEAGKASARRPRAPLGSRPCVAFAVTEVDERGGTGDYFTALELGSAIAAQEGWRVRYLGMASDWYELEGVDVLIVMRDEYDLARARVSYPDVLAVAWARNWFDRWAQRPWVADYDLVWASSRQGSAHLAEAVSRPVPVLPVATNPRRFEPGATRRSLATDYCFTGGFFYAPREFMYHLEPSGLPFEFGIFGHGWEHAPLLGAYARGPVPYPSVPDVYASTRLVIDDAQFPVKRWGSVNCRVFDVLAAGTMVITNGATGAGELFGELLPTYSNKQELDDLLWRYLEDNEARAERVKALRELVLAQHTYEQRARDVIAGIRAVTG